MTLNALRQWKLVCPKSDADLVFPSPAGEIQDHKTMAANLDRLVVRVGLVVPARDARGKPKRDADGKPVMAAKYTGMHALRHFYASWLINRKVNGGCELDLKTVQLRLGRRSTSDRRK
jgi:integrase